MTATAAPPPPLPRQAPAPSLLTAPILPALLREPSEPLRLAAAGMAGSLKIAASEGLLLAVVGDKSLGGNTRRAIDFHEGEEIDEEAFKALISEAAAFNEFGG